MLQENSYNQKNNYLEISGKISSEFSYSHSVLGEEFYSFVLESKRLSKNIDKLNCLAPRYLLTNLNLNEGDFVLIKGSFRSYNNVSNGGGKLQLNIFSHRIEKIHYQEIEINKINLIGFICKEPINRLTPFGREITDILLAVNRKFNRTDYIPCIFWGKNAKLASRLNIGQQIEISGRIQSRDYEKKISELESITKTAYEVSIGNFRLIN